MECLGRLLRRWSYSSESKPEAKPKCREEDSGHDKDGPCGVPTGWNQTAQDGVPIKEKRSVDGSAPDTARDPVGETNLGRRSVDGSAPDTARDPVGETNLGRGSVDGSTPDTARDPAEEISLGRRSVEGSPPGTTNDTFGLTNQENPEKSAKNGETASESSNWADEVEKMKANEEDNEKNKRTSGRSDSGRGNGTANPSPEENQKNRIATSTPRKDFQAASSAELQAKEQSSRLSVEGQRPPSLGAGDCGDLPFLGADRPCVRQPLLGADEPSPRVKMKIGQSTSAGKLPSSLQELRSLGRMGSFQVSLAAGGKEIQSKDWDAKKVLTGASASAILSNQSGTGWMNTYKITDETAVEPSTAPFLLHSGVKDPKTLSETLISKKVGAEKEGVQLEAMYYMNRKNRLDTQVEIERYRERVLTNTPDSPDRDLELSQIEILRDYENKFFDEHEESILQKIKENDKQIKIEAGKRDLIAFYEARVDMIETAEEMKTWVQNRINEIQKMKTRNVIPTAKKSTFTKGVSEKVKAWVQRVGRILQTSLQMAKRTRDEKIFHTKEIKELLKTLDEEASEIYKWKKAGKKLLEGLENPKVIAEEARQPEGMEVKRMGREMAIPQPGCK